MNFSLEFLSVPFGALLGAVFGGVMTWLVSALMAKRAIFRWSTRIDRIGFSMDSPVPDTVRVEWRGNKVPNLYMASMEVENTSSKDFENVSLTAHTRDGTRLLDEWTVIVNTPDRVKWSPDFEREVVLESTESANPTRPENSSSGNLVVSMLSQFSTGDSYSDSTSYAYLHRSTSCQKCCSMCPRRECE